MVYAEAAGLGCEIILRKIMGSFLHKNHCELAIPLMKSEESLRTRNSSDEISRRSSIAGMHVDNNDVRYVSW